MNNYLELCRDIMDNGVEKETRTGLKTKSLFGKTLSWNLSDGFPILTTRKVALRLAFEETMFFLRGQLDTTILEDKKINIWKGNTSRNFLDSVGLTHLPVGNMGKGYGFQMRNFNGDIDDTGLGIGGVDQIVKLVDGLKNNPYDRRHVVTHWNPAQLHEAALPPCHLMHMYSVADNKLHSSFIMRSNDVYLGLPYNIMCYAFLNMAFAKLVDLDSGSLVYFGQDVHLYENQYSSVVELIERQPCDLPQLVIRKELNTLDDLLALEFTDLELLNYNPLPDLPKVEMAI